MGKRVNKKKKEKDERSSGLCFETVLVIGKKTHTHEIRKRHVGVTSEIVN